MSSIGLTWLEQKIPEFAQLPAEDKTAIFDFSILWSFFEGTKLNRRADVSTIRAYAEKLENTGHLDTLGLTPYIAYFKDRYFKNGEYTNHFLSLYIERSGNPEEVKKMIEDNNPSKKECLVGCLVIVYRFRNNLFHGEKWRYHIKDQLLNFTHASKLLFDLMD